MQQPIAIVNAAYAAFGRGDIAGVLACLADDIEWTFDGSTGEPYMRTARGKEDVQRWFGQVLAVDGIEAFEPRRMLAGPDHVTVLGWERTRALPDGGVFESNWIHVWEVRGERIVRFLGMFDAAAAAAVRPRAQRAA